MREEEGVSRNATLRETASSDRAQDMIKSQRIRPQARMICDLIM